MQAGDFAAKRNAKPNGQESAPNGTPPNFVRHEHKLSTKLQRPASPANHHPKRTRSANAGVKQDGRGNNRRHHSLNNTDTSNIGADTTLGSVQQMQAAHLGGQDGEFDQEVDFEQGSDLELDDGEVLGPYQKYVYAYQDRSGAVRCYDNPEEAQQGSSLVRRTIVDADVKVSDMHDGGGLPRVPNDSYPPTTSGRPSELDPNDNNDRHDRKQPQMPGTQTAASNMTTRASRHIGGLISQSNGQPKGLPAQYASQFPTHDGGLGVQSSDDDPDHFTMAANLRNKPKAGRHTQIRAPNTVPSSLPVASMVPVNKAVPAAPQEDQLLNPRLPQNASVVRGDATRQRSAAAVQHVPPQLPSRPEHQQRPHQKHYQPPQSRQQQQAEQYGRFSPSSQPEETVQDPVQLETPDKGLVDARHADAAIQYRDRKTSEASPQRLLDHNPAELFDMEYNSLKETSFDVDPNSAGFRLPVNLQDLGVSEKTGAVAKFSVEDQQEFFASLSLKDWELAGDWFLERFGHVLNGLRLARHEKRQAAKDFENEIEQRHEAVSNKRKLTEDALGDMKKSGGKVLQNTPKKMKG